MQLCVCANLVLDARLPNACVFRLIATVALAFELYRSGILSFKESTRGALVHRPVIDAALPFSLFAIPHRT